MRCAQCGAEVPPGAAFCSRCGARAAQPRPAAVREYALSRIRPSWWHFKRQLLTFVVVLGIAIYLLADGPANAHWGRLLLVVDAVTLGLIFLARRAIGWSLTSDRLIERRGVLASHRREMELMDVRSIEVDRSLLQRMLGLGNVTVASAASAEFLIRMIDIPNPEQVADMLRQARLKRLA
jgi:uncharacterized membrane protein YdbT with pleckstrin-like domain